MECRVQENGYFHFKMGFVTRGHFAWLDSRGKNHLPKSILKWKNQFKNWEFHLKMGFPISESITRAKSI